MTGGQFVGEARRQAYWITIEVWHRRVTSQKLPITSRSALWPFFVAFLFQAGILWSGTSQSWFLNLQANCRNWRCNVVDHSRRTWPLICSFFQDNLLTFLHMMRWLEDNHVKAPILESSKHIFQCSWQECANRRHDSSWLHSTIWLNSHGFSCKTKRARLSQGFRLLWLSLGVVGPIYTRGELFMRAETSET